MRSTACVKSSSVTRFAVAAGRDDCGLVDQVGQIGAGEPRRDGRDLGDVEIGGDLRLAQMDLQDRDAPDPCPGRSTTTCRSKRPARSRAGSRISGRLVAASSTMPSRGSKPSSSASSWFRVCSFSSLPPRPKLLRALPSESSSSMKMMQGATLLRLLEQVADPGRADADEHLDELRTRDREERHAGLACDGAREQGLAGPRRADQQDALRNARAKAAEALALGQEGDDLAQLDLGFVDAGDVVEGHAGLLLDVDLGLRFADVHHSAESLLVGHLRGRETSRARRRRVPERSRTAASSASCFPVLRRI